MPEKEKKYRFSIIQAFDLPDRPKDLPKERALRNYDMVKHLLEDVAWDYHPGPMAPYGDWPVENREELALVAAGRCQVVREACESGKYNGIVLLGGTEPGFFEAREIARDYHLPVTACAWAQMHMATMLGNKFSVIDVTENQSMACYDLVVRHHMEQRCASIRNINFPIPRPGYPTPSIMKEREKALKGERSEAVERAVIEAVDAIENDGAEVITFGCSGSFWLQPFVQKRLLEMGWEVPVLEGYSCAITLAKAMVDLKVDASGLFFPGVRPKKWRRKKLF